MSDHGRTLVELIGVHKSYQVGGDLTPVLRGIDIGIAAGEFVAIVGASGNGKSTLLNMIAGIDRPSAGQVIATGRPIHQMSEEALAAWRGRNLGIVFQFFQLLPALSLLKNVILPMDLAGDVPRHQRRARALALLAMVGLADHADKLPSMVSGGQQQRAAIARALANDPPLILADEPTGNLDLDTSDDVFRIFQQLVAGGKTLVVVTHDSHLADCAERVVEVANGRIVRDERRPTGDCALTRQR